MRDGTPSSVVEENLLGGKSPRTRGGGETIYTRIRFKCHESIKECMGIVRVLCVYCPCIVRE